MPALAEFIRGPWRAVTVLGVTQILAWGAIFYTPVLMVPLIAEDRGFSGTFAMGGFSIGLLCAGFVSPTIGSLIDRHGGHRVMPFGSLAGAAGLVGLTLASDPVSYVVVWMLLGVAMSASLYDPAFATIVDVLPEPADATSCTRLSKQMTARACSSVRGVFSIRSKKARSSMSSTSTSASF